MIKNWKKLGVSSWLNVNSKRHRILIVDKNTGGKYNVILGQAGGERLLHKMFKTKKQALAYAKAYMKKH